MSLGHDLSNIRYTGNRPHNDVKVAVVVSKWNTEITTALFEGAVRTLIAAGVQPDKIVKLDVPGSFELPTAADMLLSFKPSFDGVICLGCVIQGETRHFDFICNACAKGIVDVSLKHHKPVIFGVLTPENSQQAIDRAGGKYGNKGEEAAVALLEMLDLGRFIWSKL